MALSVEHTAEFRLWLSKKLKSLKTDDEIFGDYIRGILTDDDSIEEKRDALEGLLSEIVNTDEASHVDEIIQKWQTYEPVKSTECQRVVNVDDELSKLIESHTLATTTTRIYTEEEKKIREAILSQYSELTDDEGEDEACGGEEEVERNTNAADVAAAAKERREIARSEAARKKEKDKEDREKQKQQREDKKEKRKTVKGERRR